MLFKTDLLIIISVNTIRRTGTQLGHLEKGDVVDVKIEVTGNSLNLADVLDVNPSNGFDVVWEFSNGVLDVTLTATRDTNLQGNPFDVTFKVAEDGMPNTAGELMFDIQSVTVGGIWESNDQAQYNII